MAIRVSSQVGRHPCSRFKLMVHCVCITMRTSFRILPCAPQFGVEDFDGAAFNSLSASTLCTGKWAWAAIIHSFYTIILTMFLHDILLEVQISVSLNKLIACFCTFYNSRVYLLQLTCNLTSYVLSQIRRESLNTVHSTFRKSKGNRMSCIHVKSIRLSNKLQRFVFKCLFAQIFIFERLKPCEWLVLVLQCYIS